MINIANAAIVVENVRQLARKRAQLAQLKAEFGEN